MLYRKYKINMSKMKLSQEIIVSVSKLTTSKVRNNEKVCNQFGLRKNFCLSTKEGHNVSLENTNTCCDIKRTVIRKNSNFAISCIFQFLLD